MVFATSVKKRKRAGTHLIVGGAASPAPTATPAPTLEERRIELEEKKTMIELMADEKRVMMMDPRTMDTMTR
jgi:hypothetical protein